MLSGHRIAFIGGGVMGEAMVKGLLRDNLVTTEQLIVADPHAERLEHLRTVYEIPVTTSNAAAVDGRSIVILCVKPQVMRVVLPDLNGRISPSALVLSIAAGVSLETLMNGLASRSVVRAMPNTPAQIGQGITVWVPTPYVTPEQLEQTKTILSAMGETVHADDESFLDMATALSGSGPAYVLLFMEAMIDAGVHLGFSRKVAEQLVIQTMEGTVAYARQARHHPATLRNEVTSAGGTTAEALYHLEKGGFRNVIARAVWAAYQRSVALGSGNKDVRLGGRSPEKD